jgi:hypothetical protein
MNLSEQRVDKELFIWNASERQYNIMQYIILHIIQYNSFLSINILDNFIIL